MMWLRKIDKRKTQFAIIALLTMMATAILTACISFTIETQNFVKQYYKRTSCPKYFIVSARDDADKLLMDDAKAAKVIGSIEKGTAKCVTADFHINDRLIANDGNFVYGLKEVNDIVTVSEGEKKKTPGDGEIWIPHVFADMFDVKVGDEFRIGDEDEYTVSAIVNSRLCTSGFIDTYPFYMNENELEDLTGVKGYAYQLYATEDTISQKEIEEAFSDEFLQSVMYSMNKSVLERCLAILPSVFGGTGVTAAIIILCVSIIVFRYLIRATIAKEYQMIGIYKALGRENKEIGKMYLKAYMISGIIGMVPGIFLARPLARYFANAVLNGLKGFELTNDTLYIGMGVIGLFSVILWVNVASEIGKVRNISPLQAMNLQNLSSEEKLYKAPVRNAHSSFSMAINDIAKRPGISLLVIMILVVSVYMNLVSGSVALTLANYSNNREIWENFPFYNCVVKPMEDEKGLEYVKNSDMVKDYVQANFSPDCNGLKIEGTDWTAGEAHPMVYENFTEERYEGVPITKGRMCLTKNEITVSHKFLKEVGKKVVYYLELKNDDKTINCLITGSYSALMYGGKTFYIQEQDFEELGYTVNYDTIMVFLKNAEDYDAFAEGFRKNVDEAKIYKDFIFIQEEGDTVSGIANPICIVLSFAFAAFSILNIINLIHTQNKENRRKYGILKAMGFTTGYIFRENIFSLTIEFAVAVLITIVLHELVSPALFSIACGVYFVLKPMWLTALVCGAMYILLITVATVMLLSIRKIKPVELMEE